MSSFKDYSYKPLSAKDEIRLIILNPASSMEDPLTCSLIQHRRSVQKEYYFAVSYAWGKPEFSRNLEIRSDGDVSCLQITPVVNDLLRHFREQKKYGCLWIDAICLDQANEVEKAHQIPEMGRIYREAFEVLIWSGPGGSEIQELFDYFRSIVSTDAYGGSGIRALPGAFSASPVVYGLFNDFSNRAWFSRRWVIQEALLAREATVYCGNYSIPLPMLSLAANHLHSFPYDSYPIKVMASLGVRRRTYTPYTLLELLWTFDESICLEPKDRVAALYGLSRDNYGYQLDYTVHWTEMYKQIALSVLRNGDNDAKLQLLLHLFEFGPVDPPYGTDYPPWVPDWSSHRRRDLPYHSLNNTNALEPYPTSPGYPAKATLKLYHDFLQVHWNTLVSEPQGWQAVYATKYDSRQRESTLSELFQHSPSSARGFIPFLELTKKVKKLQDHRDYHTYKEYIHNKDASYERHMQPQFPKPLYRRVLGTRSELRGFYIFRMEPTVPTHELYIGYGVASQPVQPGDMMIPLWKLDWNVETKKLVLDGSRPHTTTMLVVRHTPDSPLYESLDTSNVKKPVATGRLVGGAVCMLFKYNSRTNESRMDVAGNDSDRKQYSMRLI
ncbi:HET-domain-containing protein [Rostrohypoxylon terebratum]|nr:HET-domain-containing protein [Rostrohypoxylon terebratum]